jgi:glycosyltransferase involved in cell wall biosynthesis
MKIVQLITNRDLRGAQVFAAQLADQLAGRGHNVKLVSLYGRLTTGNKVLADKAETIELDGTKKVMSFSLVIKLRRLLREFSPDIVQANGSDTLKYAVLASLLMTPKPRLIYRNISMAGSWVRGGFQKRLYRYFFGRIDHVVSLTQTTRDEFVSVYRYPENKISTIPIGVEVPDQRDRQKAYEALVALTGASHSDTVLLHIGSFTKEKNHEGLLRIFERIKAKIPSAILVMVGDGPLRSGLSQQIAKLKIAGAVFLPGSRTDVSDWIGGAAVFLLPSLIEGLPGVILEAMAWHVPVVAYKVGAISEIVEDSKNGYVVPVNDESSFAEKTIALLENEPRRVAFGDEAYDKMKSAYTLDKISGEFERTYMTLTGRR